MDLLRSFTIGGKVVHPVGKVGTAVEVFVPEDDDLDATFYFVENGKVTHKMEVTADMGQGTCYISGYDIEEV